MLTPIFKLFCESGLRTDVEGLAFSKTVTPFNTNNQVNITKYASLENITKISKCTLPKFSNHLFFSNCVSKYNNLQFQHQKNNYLTNENKIDKKKLPRLDSNQQPTG